MVVLAFGRVALLLVGVGLAYFAYLVTQVYLRWSVLQKMPHNGASRSTIGAKGPVRAKGSTFERLPLIMAKEADRLGTGIYSFRLLHKIGVVVTDPILISQGLLLPKEKEMYTAFNSLTSPDGHHPNLLGHFTHDGYWKVLRKGVAPAFSPRNIRNEFPHLLEVVDRLCGAIASAGPNRTIDIDNLLQREGIDVIGKIGFGVELGATRLASDADVVDVSDIFVHFKESLIEVTKRWTWPGRTLLRHVLPSACRGSAHMAAVQAHMRTLMKEVKARGLSDDDTSIAAYLQRIKDPATGRALLDDDRLAAEIGLFFFTGFETTGHTMAWTLYCLSRHPSELAKVEAELDQLGLLVTPERPSPRQIEYKDLSALQSLGRAIKEAMRLIPVVTATVRQSPSAIELGGYEIPANVPIFLLFYGLHNSERNWERPEEYCPDRWLQPGAEYWQGQFHKADGGTNANGHVNGHANGHANGNGTGTNVKAEGLLQAMDSEGLEQEKRPRRFLPFSGGARSCIGQNLAILNFTTTLAVILSRFTIHLPVELNSNKAQYRIQRNLVTLQPGWNGELGLPMRCVPRVCGVKV